MPRSIQHSSVLLSSSQKAPHRALSCLHCSNQPSTPSQHITTPLSNPNNATSQQCTHLSRTHFPHLQRLTKRPHRIASYSTIISTNNTSISLINDILQEMPSNECHAILQRSEESITLWRDLNLRNRDFLLMHLEMMLNRNYTTARRLYRRLQENSNDSHAILRHLEQQLYRYTDVIAFQYFGSGATRLGTELFTSSDMYITAILMDYERDFTGNVERMERVIADMLHHEEEPDEELRRNYSLENVLQCYSRRTNEEAKTFVIIHDDITDEKLDKYPIDNFTDYRRQMMRISLRLAQHDIKLFHYYTGRGTAVAHQVHYDPHHFNAPKTYHAMLDVLSVEDIQTCVSLNENFQRYFHTGLIGHFAQKLFEQSGGVPIYLEHALRIILQCSVILISGYDVEQLVEVTIPEFLEKHAPDLHNYRMHSAFDRNAAIILYAMAYHGVVLSKDTLIDVDSHHLQVSVVELLARYPFYIQVINRQEQTFRIVHCPYHTRLFRSQFSDLQKVDPRYQFYFPDLPRSFTDETNFVVEQLVRFSCKKSKTGRNEYDPEHVSNLNKLLSSVKVVSGERILVDDVPITSKQIKLKLDVYDQKVYTIMIGPTMEETVHRALEEIGMKRDGSQNWIFLDLREQEAVGDLSDFRTNSLYLFEREGQYD